MDAAAGRGLLKTPNYSTTIIKLVVKIGRETAGVQEKQGEEGRVKSVSAVWK